MQPHPYRRYVLVGVVALVAIVLGVGAALYLPGVLGDDTEPQIAVVELDGMIDDTTAEHVESALREARQNDSIEGVVLEINSNGGLPAESERIHHAVSHTAEEMPVIATVDTQGASGAYLAMVGADEIYAAPSAQAIGSVGVVGPVAPPISPNDGATGPNKGQIHPDDDLERSEKLANLFADTVIDERGDALELERDELMRADIYLGVEATEYGLVDDLGHTDRAIENAAADAGLTDYEVTRFERDLADDPIDIFFEVNENGQIVPYADNESQLIGVHLAMHPTHVVDTTNGGEEP